MPFPDETPLSNVLAYIRQATATPTDRGLQVYVDPIGMQEAERSLNSTVQIDLDNIPLKKTLKLSLDQLGLAYEVKDGYLSINCAESMDLHVDPQDPFQIVGHCLLALVAAGIGAMAGPIAAGSRREQETRVST